MGIIRIATEQGMNAEQVCIVFSMFSETTLDQQYGHIIITMIYRYLPI